MKCLGNTGGFTIIDLLAVLSIAAVVTALLLPATQTTVTSAGTVACMNNQREIGWAVLLYALDYDGWVQSNGSCCGASYPAGHMKAGEPLAGHWALPLEEGAYVAEGPVVEGRRYEGYNQIFECPNRPSTPEIQRGRRSNSGIQAVGEMSIEALAKDQATEYKRWGKYANDSIVGSPRFVRLGYAPDPREFPFIGDAWQEGNQATDRITGYRNVYVRHERGFYLAHGGPGEEAANVWFVDGHVERLQAAGLAEIGFWGAVNRKFEWINTCDFVDDPECTGPFRR